jgi:hypothetical protein
MAAIRDGRGNQQETVVATNTGEYWFDCIPGQHFRFAVNAGHGATYDVILNLVGASGDISTPVKHIDSTGNTGAVSVSGRPGIVRIGVDITAFPSGSDFVMELSQAKG